MKKLIDDRESRRQAAKAEAARKRRELALSVPLTETEKVYIEGFPEGARREEQFKKLIDMRYAVLKKFALMPECERFVMICFDEPRRIKVIPEAEYFEEKSRAAVFARAITKEEFSSALLEAVGGI